jgi:hypothetical protein
VIIDVDLTGPAAAVELVEPDNLKEFHVAARGGDAAALSAGLEAAGVGRLLPSGEAMIETSAVRRLAAGRVPEGWDGEFAGMLEYAESKGWLDESGTQVQAHVEWSA